MTGWDLIDRTDLLHAIAAAGLPTDAETCGSAQIVRFNPEWIRDTFIPYLDRNRRAPQGDGYRCVHFVHWMIEALNEAGYDARIPTSHGCAKAHCVLHSREAHAVGLLTTTDNQLYVLDPQDPKLVPLADYPVLAWSRVRFL